MKRVLAFDLGASGGRAMLAVFDGKTIQMEELHRFSNDPVFVRGTLYWDVLRMLFEIKQGITKAVNAGGFDLLGIDTWGVDFGLIGKDGQLVDNPVHYRDSRTDQFETLYSVIPQAELYARTGIQKIQLNTIHQLAYLKRYKPELLARTQKVLFMPDLLNYFLTGEMKTEYTVASTSELLNVKTRNWDFDLIRRIGLDTDLFCKIVHPGTVCGVLSKEIQEELGAPAAQVLCVASHDTASAISVVPTQEKHFIYISSGTWSMLGTELQEPQLDARAARFNFTNEGGVDHTIRFLKNIMGTWLSQESRRQWRREGRDYSFDELDRMSAESTPFLSFINVDDPGFIKPGDIPARIRAYCERTGQVAPRTEGAVIRCIQESLAMRYRNCTEMVEGLTGMRAKSINILGGGIKNVMVCQMTADATGKTVYAGPVEATALGNCAAQLIAAGEIEGTEQARRIVAQSCDIKTYTVREKPAWDEAYTRYLKVLEKQ